jgi:aspartyl-tRNA(Asn)/glutamyl-tRNA(Gln) amidotransferase subunit B
MSTYLQIIGMEIHVELRTKSKMFCGCPADHFSKSPNTQTCPVCLGLPGALPVPNRLAVTWAQMIGLALNCELTKDSKFDRKHYFYPDLSKGYQISQYDEPLCLRGNVKTPSGLVNITRVHLEEDTGKLQHVSLPGYSVGAHRDAPTKVSLVDFNRSGVPLVEIVSEPDIHSAAAAKDYAQTIRTIVNFLGVSDADMEKGSMRLEANISLARNANLESPITLPPYKVEVKNINSFRFLERAIEYEIKRQTELLEQGITPDQETRGFNEAKMATVSQRSKEDAKDYRYFPEPDIPPMIFSDQDINEVKKLMPKLPADYLREFRETYQVREDFAQQLVEHRKLAEKSLMCFKLAPKVAQKIASFLINKKTEAETLKPEQIITIITKPQVQVMNSDTLDTLVQESIKANPTLVEKYKAGKTTVIGAFVGDVMRRSHGTVNPKELTKLLIAQLNSK